MATMSPVVSPVGAPFPADYAPYYYSPIGPSASPLPGYSPVGYSPVSDYASSASTAHSPASLASLASLASPSAYTCSRYADVPFAHCHAPEAYHKKAAQLHYSASVELDSAIEGQDIARSLDCLDSLASAIPFLDAAPYPAGMRGWLRSVQKVTNMVKRRSVIGNPLTPGECACIDVFVKRWLAFRGGANDMGAPEAQIVLLSLEECLLLF